MLKLENNKKLALGKVVGEIKGSNGVTVHEVGEKLNVTIQQLAFHIESRLNDKYSTMQIVNSLMDWDWEVYYEELDKNKEFDELHLALVELGDKIELVVDIVNMGYRVTSWEHPEVSCKSLELLAKDLRKELLS